MNLYYQRQTLTAALSADAVAKGSKMQTELARTSPKCFQGWPRNKITVLSGYLFGKKEK